jgi:large subunit ribosomal protein L6
MSRLYKEPLVIPAEVTLLQHGNTVEMTHKTLTFIKHFHHLVQLTREDNLLTIAPRVNSPPARMHAGTVFAIMRNMFTGFITPYTITLKLVGVGYKVSLEGKCVSLMVNLSHPAQYTLPAEVTAQVISNTELLLTSVNKELVGKASSEIRAIRPPEPYKGKGIRYSNEVIKLKARKK